LKPGLDEVWYLVRSVDPFKTRSPQTKALHRTAGRLVLNTGPLFNRVDKGHDHHAMFGIAFARGCVDMRDKFFGLLSLVSLLLHVDPDYATRTQELLFSFLRGISAYQSQDGFEYNPFENVIMGTLGTAALTWQEMLDNRRRRLISRSSAAPS
jgi:hypothetical protein